MATITPPPPPHPLFFPLFCRVVLGTLLLTIQFVATLSVLIGVMITITAVLPVFIVAIVPIMYCYYRVQVRWSFFAFCFCARP